MKEKYDIQRLRKACFNNEIFPQQILDWIASENLWNIWVPKQYGGCELSFSEGLQKLQELAQIDGSLGWTITLCCGANFFIGNLKPKAAAEVFENPRQTILGGSGGAFGTAEKIEGKYRIYGTWHYATGAPYLSHFTLNAKIMEDGKPLFNENGTPQIRSFILPKEKVSIIEDWDTIGLKASATHSFKVENVAVHERFSFIYNEIHLSQDIFKIPFTLFADLTLWVNYIGMAKHFLEEAQGAKSRSAYEELEEHIKNSDKKLLAYAKEVETQLAKEEKIQKDYQDEIHKTASDAVKELSQAIVALHPFLGIKAIRLDFPLHQIFCDYFTATQHHIFVK